MGVEVSKKPLCAPAFPCRPALSRVSVLTLPLPKAKVLEVRITGEVDPETGYLMDIKLLSDIIKSEIEDRFDHKNLNLDTVEFKDLNPTAEHIAYIIWHLLRAHLAENLDLHIRLYETPRNFVEYPV